MSLADSPFTPSLIPQEICRDFSRSSRLEWLETNHTGAFAMGTVAGVNTRRYHSLLLASLNPPADRYSILPRVEETCFTGAQSFALATVQYQGVVQPRGYQTLTQFAAQPFPTWSHQCGSLSLTKSVCLLDGQQAVLVRYQATADCRLEVRLFLSCRNYHSLTHENSSLNMSVVSSQGALSIQLYANLPPLHFLHNGSAFQPGNEWYLRHEYLREFERGLDFEEDLFSPGSLSFQLTPDRPAFFIAALEPNSLPGAVDLKQAEEILEQERRRRGSFNSAARSLDQFRVRRSDGQPTLVAGFPWFTDWSRDTLISLPALAAAGFPSDDTRAILQMLVSEKKQGILPNRFSDLHSVPEYNTVDASLWFFIAAHSYFTTTNDTPFLKDVLYPAALDIIGWHFRGTFFNTIVDPSDQLLSAGDAGVQLTWMDAKIGNYVVTPRTGKPVEINALWYNALRITSEWARLLEDHTAAADLSEKAAAVYQSFNLHFWNAADGCLHDVVGPGGPDTSFRPNQIFALSLPYQLLQRERAQSVCRLLRARLLTPVGLRTLAPDDRQYKPRFEGGMDARDRAYHQGTVWPWLIGPFINAWLYAFDESRDAVEECRRILAAMETEFNRCCLGTLSEVYDAESPQLPGGCPAQLWSVSQVILAAQRLAGMPPS